MRYKFGVTNVHVTRKQGRMCYNTSNMVVYFKSERAYYLVIPSRGQVKCFDIYVWNTSKCCHLSYSAKLLSLATSTVELPKAISTLPPLACASTLSRIDAEKNRKSLWVRL